MNKIKDRLSFISSHLPLIITLISIAGGLEQFITLYKFSSDLLIFYSTSQIIINGIVISLILLVILLIIELISKILFPKHINNILLYSSLVLLIIIPFIRKKVFIDDFNNSKINIKSYATNSKNQTFNLVYYNNQYAFYQEFDSLNNKKDNFIIKEIKDVLNDDKIYFYRRKIDEKEEKYIELNLELDKKKKKNDSIYLDIMKTIYETKRLQNQ